MNNPLTAMSGIHDEISSDEVRVLEGAGAKESERDVELVSDAVNAEEYAREKFSQFKTLNDEHPKIASSLQVVL